jgi:hypothetical protein
MPRRKVICNGAALFDLRDSLSCGESCSEGLENSGTLASFLCHLSLCRNTVHGSSASPRTVLLDRKFKSLSVRPELVEGL